VSSHSLPARFRKLTVGGRRDALREACGLTEQQLAGFGTDPDMLERADVMVEYAVGYVAVPIGVAPGFVIDGETRNIPLATEEPSVVAAAAFAGSLVSREGGFTTRASEPLMTAQVYLRNAPAGAEGRVLAGEQRIRSAVAAVLARMESRGGGLRRIEATRLTGTDGVNHLRVHLHVDVRDAMGANILNSVAESARPVIEELSGGEAVMCILSNAAADRTAEARFSIPVAALSRRGFTGEQVAARVVEAAAIADTDPDRAVTHNKGIMNGVSALALATGNDTRAIESAAHRFAVREGRYGSLTRFALDSGRLEGRIELPAPFGTVGGAADFHPAAKSALAVLGNPDAQTLGRIAASLGLAQNLAALSALVSEGIQQGHMRLHARRLAFDAGARGEEIAAVAARLHDSGLFDRDQAEALLREVRDDVR